jgi:hypothetical protein
MVNLDDFPGSSGDEPELTLFKSSRFPYSTNTWNRGHNKPQKSEIHHHFYGPKTLTSKKIYSHRTSDCQMIDKRATQTMTVQ